MSRLERKNSFYKKVALLVVFNMLFEIIAPTAVMALTSGPSSPEFGSFEPVATNNMVDPFTGDFTYNLPVLMVPGANGGGYPISLSYHSGTTGEQEASWVGLGWSLNPGAINRGKQGFPDDWNGEKVVNHNKSIPNTTITAGLSVPVEVFSYDGMQLNAGLTYNNYKGLGYTAGGGFSLAKGFVSLGFNISDGQTAYSLRVDPWKLLSQSKKREKKISKEFAEEVDKINDDCGFADQIVADLYKKHSGRMKDKSSSTLSVHGLVSLAGETKANQVNDYTGVAFNFSSGVGVFPTLVPAGAEAKVQGSFALQRNKPKTENEAYGFYYNKEAYDNDDNLMDYYTEKEHPYENNDIFLGIPHALADQYAVTGEGVGGAFRMHNKSIGQFRPNKVNSELIIGNIGFSSGFGLNIDAGFNIGAGYHRFTQKSWELKDGQEEYSTGKENKIFRFVNDLGGLVTFSDDDQNESAELFQDDWLPGFKNYSPDVSNIDQSINTDPANNNSVGASSYIGHNTIEERNAETGGVKYNAYEKDPSISNFVDFDEEAIKNQIGEMSVKNKSGETYNYGLPVFARNERDISVGNKGVNATVENGYLAYGDIGINTQSDRNKLRIIQGQERNAPYVTTYLLTSIYEPNYIDRTNDGPTEDDFGGYTKFGYKQVYGSTGAQSKTTGGNWYHWRFPYTGMYYNRGRLSDKKDDMLSYNSGQKEMYYLENIETKTHIAIFHTSDRTDGLSAHHNNDEADHDESAKGNQHLQKLDKIELFVKDEVWEAYVASGYDLALKPAPLKRVNFEYDYSLVPGIPNSSTGEGKLTLKRVWFDYDGIYEAQISPYEFEYNYPEYNTYPLKYRSGTDDVTQGYSAFNLVGPSAQNIAYHEQQLNAWGYNQGIEEGKSANDRMNPWLNQTLENGSDDNLDSYAYDPAAWNLKRIILPSGGEIHVQYEQDDYAYVQDKQAHVMVPLLASSDDDGNSPRYHLDTDAIGVTTAEKRDELVDAINKWYVLGDEKIYFRFLYSVSDSNLDPQINECNSEYITGYINVEATGIDAGKVFIDLQADIVDERFDLPKKVCKEYAKAFLSGKLVNENCGLDGDLSYEDEDPEDAIFSFLNSLSDFDIPGTTSGCAEVNFRDSYFRVPAVNPKKGGGLRVKRLMMYTPSLNPEEEAELYGTEYIYQFKDVDGKVKSSGVAVNEPAAIREENILVNNIDRLPKDFWDKASDLVVAGEEKAKFEGPIGESLYGSASVGYSQVITRNIHSGKTNTGFTVQQFHTAKDFPLVSEFTDLAGNTKKDYLPIPALWINNLTNNVWAAQGFHFTINNMHGQMKRTALFTGDYSQILGPVSANLVSATEYEYFDVEEPLPVMNSLEEIEYVNLGKETEIYMESRSVTDHLHDVSVEFDASVGFAAIPIPFGSVFPSYTHTETELHTHVTNKITRYPAMVKSVRNYTDGIWSKSENLAFNPQTGDPVITRTYDDFNSAAEEDQFQIDGNDHEGWLTAYGIPAHMEYANMDQVIINQGKTYSSTGTGYQVNKVYYPGSGETRLDFINAAGPFDPCDIVKSLATGDLIQLNTATGEIYHISEITGNSVAIVPTYFASPITSSATAINFTVIRSGRTNQASANVGDFVTYGRTAHPTGILPEIADIAISDPTHPDYGLYTDRLAFVASLNGLLGGAGGTTAIPPGMFVDLLDPSICWSEGDSYVSVYVGGGEVQVGWAGSTDCNQNLTEIAGAAFHINPENGAIYYGFASGDCNPQALECLVFCEQLYPIKSVERVLSASAMTLADEWDFDETIYDNGISGYNDFELGKRGKWRLKSSYGYNASTTGLMDRFNPFTSTTTDENFNYNSGLFTLDLFNWQFANANNPEKWLKATTITRYSPNGNAVEEQNILGIKSTVKFGYNENLPYLVAGNSPYESVLFESFENTYSMVGGTAVEEQLLLQSGTETTEAAHHTGYSSLKIEGASATSFFVSHEMEFTDQIQSAGLHSKVWVKNVDDISEGVIVTMTDVVTGSTLSGNMQKVVQVGEWTLYELNYSAWGAFNPELFKIDYSIENASAGKDYFIDDLRIQPMDSEMVGYVYDYKNFRLLATLDDQNFAMLYQYSEEGQLTRKLVETMRGIKTIADGYQNTPLKDRN